jgi:hypothetical protein
MWGVRDLYVRKQEIVEAAGSVRPRFLIANLVSELELDYAVDNVQSGEKLLFFRAVGYALK